MIVEGSVTFYAPELINPDTNTLYYMTEKQAEEVGARLSKATQQRITPIYYDARHKDRGVREFRVHIPIDPEARQRYERQKYSVN